MTRVIRTGNALVITALLVFFLCQLAVAAEIDYTTGLQIEGVRSTGTAVPQVPQVVPSYNVLWDFTHGMHIDYCPSGRYSELVALLGSEGFSVDSTSAGIDNIDLSGYDVLVISVTSSWYSSYTPQEVAAAQDFVNNGGAILVMGENTDCPNENVNPITQALGTTCGVSYLTDLDLILTNFSGHSMFNGISEVYFRAAGELEVTGPSTEEAWDQYGYAALTSVNDCQMIVTGDCNFCDNTYIDNCDNRAFIVNVFNCLATCEVTCDQPILELCGYLDVYWNDPMWDVQVEVKNNGPGVAKNICVTMNSDIAWLVIPDPNCFYGDIADGASSMGGCDIYTFDLTDHPGGSFNVWFDVSYYDDCGNRYEVRLDPEFDPGRQSEGDTPITTYGLVQNYPNPFNPSTTINYQIPRAGHVDLSIYDVSGRLIKTLVNGDRSEGLHTVTWDGKDNMGVSVASGIYFYKMKSGQFVETKRMVLLR
jgi:hypothetical protein